MKQDISLFICPDCEGELYFEDGEISCPQNHKFEFKDGIFVLLPHKVNQIMEGDAAYHNQLKEEWIEINQIDTPRNLYYHGMITEFLRSKSNTDTTILEIGGGVGFDLQLFLKKEPKFQHYFFSEIHHDMACYVKNRISDKRITFILADASKLPIKSLDIIIMIATLHHLPDWQYALAKACEKVSPGGYIICGIEPNRLWLDLIKKAKNFLMRISSFKGRHGAPGDEQAEGFSIDELRKFAELHDLKIEYLTPVWFICGFLHKFVEFHFKIFNPKKRLRVFTLIEKALIIVDNYLLKLPYMEKISFHYTVIFRKA